MADPGISEQGGRERPYCTGKNIFPLAKIEDVKINNLKAEPGGARHGHPPLDPQLENHCRCLTKAPPMVCQVSIQ